MAEQYLGRDFKHWQTVFDSLSAERKKLVWGYVQNQGVTPEKDPKLVLKVTAEINAGTIDWAGIAAAQPEGGFKTEEETERVSFDEFLEGQRGATEEFITGEEARRKTRRSELSALLSEQREQAFDVNAPQILEQLESRGLFTSESTVGRSFAEEQGRLQQISENVLSQQALSDVDVIGGFRAGALERELGAEEAFLERGFSLENFGRQATLARQLAEIQATAQARSDKFGLIGDIFGFIGTAGTAAAVRGG